MFDVFSLPKKNMELHTDSHIEYIYIYIFIHMLKAFYSFRDLNIFWGYKADFMEPYMANIKDNTNTR